MCPIFTEFFVRVRYDLRSMDDNFAHNGPYRHLCNLQRVTSLRRCAQANAPAASYCLHRVLDDGGRRDYTSPTCKRYWGGAEPQCTRSLLRDVTSTSGGLHIRQNRQLPKARHGARGPGPFIVNFSYLINVHVFVKQHKLVDLVQYIPSFG